MTYSGVGRVVPSMVAVNTNASSQNATWRGTAGLLRSAAAGWSRQSAQGRSGRRLGAGAVARASTGLPAGSSIVAPEDSAEFLPTSMIACRGSVVIVASGHPCPGLTDGPDPLLAGSRIGRLPGWKKGARAPSWRSRGPGGARTLPPGPPAIISG